MARLSPHFLEKLQVIRVEITVLAAVEFDTVCTRFKSCNTLADYSTLVWTEKNVLISSVNLGLSRHCHEGNRILETIIVATIVATIKKIAKLVSFLSFPLLSWTQKYLIVRTRKKLDQAGSLNDSNFECNRTHYTYSKLHKKLSVLLYFTPSSQASKSTLPPFVFCCSCSCWDDNM